MTKKFTLLQLFSIVDGRLSSTMDDVYDILNHVTDSDLMTHHLPVAMSYLKLKHPNWFSDIDKRLASINRLKKSENELPFPALMSLIKDNYNDEYDIPQLKDEFDVSDFGVYMIDNSILLKKSTQL